MTWPWRHREALEARSRATAAQVTETREVLRELGETTYALVAWTERLAEVIEDLAHDEDEDDDA